MPPPNRAVKPVAWGALAAIYIATIGWAITIGERVTRVEEKSDHQETLSVEVRKELREINQRLSRIEGAVAKH